MQGGAPAVNSVFSGVSVGVHAPGSGGSLVEDKPVKNFILTAIFVVVGTVSAQAADPVLGIWQAPPDGKGQIGHIQIAPCGAALCGTIIRAFSPNGKPVVTPNVGKRLFWDMQPTGNGTYGKGRVYVPAHKREYAAKMALTGKKLSVKGCVGPVCQGQVWTRVK